MARILPHTHKGVRVPAGLAIFTMILCCLLAHEAVGQKEWTARYVSIAALDQINPSIARPTESAFTVTVWEDERHASAQGADIYIQRVDNSTGLNVWVRWDNPLDLVTERFDGMPVCRAQGAQRNPRAAYDSAGGVIVTWEDYRNDPSGMTAEIWAQRILLSTGEPDPNWPLDGIAVCQTGQHCERPRIVGTASGAFITWIDYRNDPGGPPRNRDVYVQFIESATATWPAPPTLWQPNGIPVHQNMDPDQINPELDVDCIRIVDYLGNSREGVVVTYQDDRYNGAFGGQAVWTVFANRIDANGQQSYNTGPLPWTADVPVTASYENQEYPRVVTTSKRFTVPDPSAIIVWQDMVEDPSQTWTNIHAQRLDANGVQQFPGPFGLEVSQAPASQTRPDITLWEVGNIQGGGYTPYVTIGWLDYRNYSMSGIDIYAALLDASGPGILRNPGTSNGDLICGLPGDQYDLSMDNVLVTSPNSERTVFAWTHETSGQSDIWYQDVTLPGWVYNRPLNGWPVSEAKANQQRPQVNREVFVWQDGRRDPILNDPQDDENIYCQTPGDCVGDPEMRWRDVFAKWTFGKDAANFRFVADPEEGSTYVVWDEVRDSDPLGSDQYRIAFIQKLDKDGVPRWSNNGVALSNYNDPTVPATYSSNATIPDVCIDAQGGARAVWQQTNSASGYEECWASHIPADGVPVLCTDLWAANRAGQFVHYREPRIVAVNNAFCHSMMAVLSLSPANITFRKVAYWPPFGAVVFATPPNLNPGIIDHSKLQIAWDGNTGIFSMTYSAIQNRIALHHHDFRLSVNSTSEAIAFVGFGGYDLTKTRPDNLAPVRPVYFTWSQQAAAGDPYEIHLGYFNHLGALATSAITANFLAPTPPPQKPDSKYPTITSDSLAPTGTHEGVLLAWDTEYYRAGGGSSHSVESNRINVPFINPPTLFGAPEFPAHLTLDAGLATPSYPDIARVINTMPGNGPFGMVVWEGGGESSPCTPARPRDIMGQYVLYDANAMNPGPQWSTPEMIAPGGGNYFQTGPQVQPSLPGAASVYWYDNQGGQYGVMGTRLPELSGSIQWAKRERQEVLAPATGLHLDAIWPQPANGSGASVLVRSENATPVTVTLYDLLGRERAVLYRGDLDAQGRVLSITPATLGLEPGSYMLRLTGGGKHSTRRFTVVR